MINFVETDKEFELYKAKYLQLSNPKVKFKENPFREPFKYFINFLCLILLNLK